MAGRDARRPHAARAGAEDDEIIISIRVIQNPEFPTRAAQAHPGPARVLPLQSLRSWGGYKLVALLAHLFAHARHHVDGNLLRPRLHGDEHVAHQHGQHADIFAA